MGHKVHPINNKNNLFPNMHTEKGGLPLWLIYTVCFCSIFPYMVHALDIKPVSFTSLENVTSSFSSLAYRNGVLHTLLESSSIALSLFTLSITALHYYFMRKPFSLYLGLIFGFSAVFDIFHVLVSNGFLVSTSSLVEPTTSFSWLAARTLQSTLIAGLLATYLFNKSFLEKNTASTLKMTSLSIMTIIVASTSLILSAESFPKYTYPSNLFVHPWDTIPLLFFTCSFIGSLFLYKKEPSHFNAAIALSLVPMVSMQLLATVQTLDNFFFCHILKIIFPIIVIYGLAVEFVKSHKKTLKLKDDFRREIQSLENNRKRAQIANQKKSEFLTHMSYELRTPLNAILGFSGLLKEELEVAGKTEMAGDAQRIYRDR